MMPPNSNDTSQMMRDPAATGSLGLFLHWAHGLAGAEPEAHRSAALDMFANHKPAAPVKANIALRERGQMANTVHEPLPPGKKMIFRPWRECPKTGKRIYASAYGKKAWPIIIDVAE